MELAIPLCLSTRVHVILNPLKKNIVLVAVYCHVHSDKDAAYTMEKSCVL